MFGSAEAEGGKAAHHGAHGIGFLIYVFAAVAVMFGLMSIAKKGLNNRFFTNKWTQRFEQLFLFLENLVVGIIGPHGRKYIPMLMVLWCMIFISNVMALFFPTSPTADLSFNLGLALISIMYVQYEGMRANGVLGHFKHFAGPKMGPALILINVMLFAIELVSEMMKNVSLSLRLFGNIDGGHKAAEAINELTKSAYIPAGAFLLPIKMLTCVVQALIFCLLTSVYLGLVTHHDHGDEHHDDEHDLAPAH